MDDKPYPLTEREQDLRTRILDTLRKLYALDPDYANWSFDRYARELPWLNLRRKK